MSTLEERMRGFLEERARVWQELREQRAQHVDIKDRERQLAASWFGDPEATIGRFGPRDVTCRAPDEPTILGPVGDALEVAFMHPRAGTWYGLYRGVEVDGELHLSFERADPLPSSDPVIPSAVEARVPPVPSEEAYLPTCLTLSTSLEPSGLFEVKGPVVWIGDLITGPDMLTPVKSLPPGVAQLRIQRTHGRVSAVAVGDPERVVSWHTCARIGVDSGTVGILDGVAASERTQSWLRGTRRSYFDEPLLEGGVFFCRSGMGDGSYPVFVGVDEQGSYCCLLVDFAGDPAPGPRSGTDGPEPDGATLPAPVLPESSEPTPSETEGSDASKQILGVSRGPSQTPEPSSPEQVREPSRGLSGEAAARAARQRRVAGLVLVLAFVWFGLASAVLIAFRG